MVNKPKQLKTKRGGVSLYIVVFMTLMFGVIALGFIRIVLNDAKETSNTDLYNSAYDSALAGIEDAKIALIKYHDCLSQGATPDSNASDGSCPKIVYEMQRSIAEDSCDVVQRVLARDQDDKDGVIIQETQDQNDDNSTAYMEQAYTCVKITEETPNYLTTLTKSDNTRIVPIHSADLAGVGAIQFGWFSNANATDYANNAGKGDSTKYMGGQLRGGGTVYAPPVVTFEIFQTDTVSGNANCPKTGGAVPVTDDSPCFTIGELSTNNTNRSGTDHALLMLYPVKEDRNNTISAATVLDHSDKDNNDKIDIQCKPDNNGYYCNATIILPDTFRHTQRATGTSFIKMTLPYDRPDTDISLFFCEGNGGDCSKTKNLTGVQAAIDSVGRANDLYRRLEARVELVDLYYPYPEYALYLSGNSDINKSFYVTRNCWRANNGDVGYCSNSRYI